MELHKPQNVDIYTVNISKEYLCFVTNGSLFASRERFIFSIGTGYPQLLYRRYGGWSAAKMLLAYLWAYLLELFRLTIAKIQNILLGN